MKKSILLLALILTLVSCKEKPKQNNDLNKLAQVEQELQDNIKIANATGLEHWKNVTEINFTFNVDRDDSHFERYWSWKPRTEDVTLIQDKDTISYNRKALDSTNIKADQAFINDKYWLLPQFEITQGKGSRLSFATKATAPISKKEMNKITVTYGEEGGYTPGDAYDFFYTDDYVLQEWIFRKSNAKEPSMTTTFENYEDFNGIKIAKDHKKLEGNWNLYFSNISVKTN